ncbi:MULTISPECIES: xanthine dehydrogenase family protein molybdopterin-binding subunit [unclassified Novosphingobium]|uniref:xanthine dehydrogenase family protein molybdopterin-binding subunit n=1 Tax=unclassified Novosphingobium TaxID=2644732 RepID=UPI00190F4725|nr:MULTISPECIES: xanthine dehydrogenase family protein molybdopterin-binding subunit [unclassified Novosphingobium]
MNIHAKSVGAVRYVGSRQPRKEDGRLLTGRGQFTDDIRLPGMLHIAYVRSAAARGRIVSIDMDAAREMPGVHAIYTQADLAAVPVAMQTFFFTPIEAPVTLLADGRVACVGDPIAMVIADSRALAEDAASLVEVVIEEETPVVTIADAKTGPLVHPDRDDNISAEMGDEDTREAIQPLLDGCAHVVSTRIRHQRIAQSPMEGRACVASPEGAGEMTVWIGCQSPHLAARYIALVLGLPAEALRVIAKDVGGGFGLKNIPWREEVAVIVAAKLLGRPLKWIEDRFEALTASSHARDQDVSLTVGFDGEGHLQAAWCDYACNNGAWPMGEDANIAVHMFMWPAYKLPAYGFVTRGWYTNTMGLGAYRGPWAMESLVRETLLDKAARKIGIDPVELRRRNLVYLTDQPHTSTLGIPVTDITPGECLEKLVASIDLAAFRKEQVEARKQGRYLGIGIATYIEPTGAAGSMAPMTGETVHLRIEPTGKVVAMLSTHSQGHGTATTMAQVIAQQLGVAYEDVAVYEGDSAIGAFSPGAAGSRQGVIAGGATWRAAEMLADKVKVVAAHLSNASVEAITIQGGMVHVAGAPEMTRSLREIAEIAYGEPGRLPEGAATGLEAQYRYQPPPMTMTSAAHCCMVEVDAETGFVKILRWISSEDCGTVINPGVVEGQIAGGLAQAIGQVLLEDMPYDARGNPLAPTFKDYLMPAISDVPDFEYLHASTPSQTIGGMRGVGEGGCIIGPPTLVNAIADALSPFGEIEELVLPLTPARVLDVIEGRDISGTRAHLEGGASAAVEAVLPVEVAAPAAAGGIDGDWNMILKTPMGPQVMVAHFDTDGSAVSGYLEAPEGRQDFAGGTLSGRQVKFEMKVEKPMKITLKYDLLFDGDSMSGKCKMGMFGSAKVSGERA